MATQVESKADSKSEGVPTHKDAPSPEGTAAMWNGWHVSTLFCAASAVAFPIALGLTMYFVKTDPAALELNGEPLPIEQWKLMQMAFATTLVLDFTSFLWTVDKGKKRLFYFVMVINGLPVITYGLLASGSAPMLVDAHGRRLVLARYVQWLFTTPAMLYLYSIISNITSRELVVAMLLEYSVICLGIGASLLPAPFDLCFLAASLPLPRPPPSTAQPPGERSHSNRAS